MKSMILDTHVGMRYEDVAKKAKALSIQEDALIEFDFNGVKNWVDKDTNIDHLYRDYANNWLMGWKTVGPNCVEEYDEETKSEMSKKQAIRDAKKEEKRKEWEVKDNAQREEFKRITDGLKIELSNKELWDKGLANNQDSYGGGIYEYAESWALLMQARIHKGESLKDIAEETSFQLGYLGITGFMYGAAVSVLSATWKYGEELREWHNKEYNHEGDGVVNPALLTLKSSDNG